MRKKAAEPGRKSESPDEGWDPNTNPAVRELLDHLADELAMEYIRLMKQAGQEIHDTGPSNGGREE